MGKPVKLKAGDIFRFQGRESLTGIGQVIEPGGVLYATILRPNFADPIEIDRLATEDILFCGWTMDALFYHDRWRVIGNLPIPEASIPRPCSKVLIEGDIWIQDFRGRPLRKASPVEAKILDNHISRSPKTYVDAFSAHHGLGEWLPRYESFAIERMKKMAAVCSG